MNIVWLLAGASVSFNLFAGSEQGQASFVFSHLEFYNLRRQIYRIN